MSTPNKTVEEFQPLPISENASLDARLLQPDHFFLGEKLFPYSLGVEGLMREALVGIRGDDLYALTFLRVLLDLQSGFDAYRKAGSSEDDATDLAVGDVLTRLHGNLGLFQAKALAFRKKVKRNNLETAIKLVAQIVQEAEDSEPIAAAPEETTPGK